MNQNQRNHKPAILAFLFLLFTLPGCLALLIYQYPQWLGSSTINNGQFISPMIKLDSLNEQSQWHLLLISDKACEAQCLTLLDKLARVRLALGRLSREVDLRLMVSEKAMLPSTLIRRQMKEVAMTSQVLSSTDIERLMSRDYRQGVFIVDPRGYLVLFYPLEAKQKGIYNDLKHLIKVAKQ